VAQRTLSLSLKIFIGISVVVIVVLGATLAITARSARTAAGASVGRVAVAAREALSAQISGRSEALLKSAATFTENSTFRDQVRQRVTADALDQSMVATESVSREATIPRHRTNHSRARRPSAAHSKATP